MIDIRGISRKYLKHTVFSLLFLAAFFSSWFKVFDIYEFQTYDWRCQLRGNRPVSDKIVLIDIWDDTVNALGAWPFDREYHAQLINILKYFGARAVAFDVLFVEPRENDDLVVQEAKNAGNVYFPKALAGIHREKNGQKAQSLAAEVLPAYEAAAKDVAHINQKIDSDGKNRRIYPVIEYNDKNFYHLGIRTALDALDETPADVTASDNSLKLKNGLKIPLDEDGCFIVNYAGKWETTFQHYSYVQVLLSYAKMTQGEAPTFDVKNLKDKICFVGLTTVASHDTKPVPIQEIYPMVGMHANVLNTILTKDFIVRIGRAANVVILLILLAWTLYLVLRFKPIRALAAFLGSVIVFLLISIGLFFWKGIWVDLFAPVFWAMVFYATGTLLRTLFEMRKRQLIENELKIASQIQQSFLPETLPNVPGLSLAVYMKPAKAVGGDLYTYVTLGEARLGVMLGDVSGKGTPAALFMAKAVSEFKFSARDKQDPAEVLTHLNNSIASESTGGLFVTLTYLIFDREKGNMVMSDGGHLPVIMVSADGSSEQLNAEQGMPIGVAPDVPFSIFERPIKKGDLFALYSDGVSEARNRRKDEYGIETLQKKLQQLKALPVKEILDKTIDDLNHFMGKADQHDDITLLIVKIE